MENDDLKAIERIDEAIDKLGTKDFSIYFFVVDSRNVPTSSIAYEYEMAKTLQDKGYNVTMLYQLNGEYTEAEVDRMKRMNKPIDPNKIFIGVGDWMGSEYADIPHMNISNDSWVIGPSDILFIPEAMSGLMFQTYQHKAPCRRVVLLNNFSNVTDFIPVGVEWKNYGIYDVVATTNEQMSLIRSVFPYVACKVVNPMVNPMFRKPIKPKKLVVSLLAKDQRVVNRIIKTFYWKYPMYKFVSFADLRGFSRDEYAEKLKDSAITVWVDNDTPFGRSALEAIACDNILLGKVPDTLPEWMMNEDGTLSDCGIWTYDINQIPDLLANIIGSWMQDMIPEELLTAMKTAIDKYTIEKWEENVESTLNDIVEKQINTFKAIKDSIQSKITSENNENQ